MVLSPLRKKLNIAVGLLFLGGVGIALWPLVSRPLELRAFCSELRPGSPLAAISGLAAEHGFKVSPESIAGAHVYDYQSFGKFSCALSLRGGSLVNASFVVGD